MKSTTYRIARVFGLLGFVAGVLFGLVVLACHGDPTPTSEARYRPQQDDDPRCHQAVIDTDVCKGFARCMVETAKRENRRIFGGDQAECDCLKQTCPPE